MFPLVKNAAALGFQEFENLLSLEKIYILQPIASFPVGAFAKGVMTIESSKL